MSTITSHILDIGQGRPAAGIEAVLFIHKDNAWPELYRTVTNPDGRIAPWTIGPGEYKLRFETRNYFHRHSVATFYPFVDIHFTIGDDTHYHVPLLLSAWGYSTYRGS